MKEQRDAELLAMFGLAGVMLGKPQLLAWPKEEVEEAKGMAPLLVAAALLTAEPPETTAVFLRALDQIGVRVRAAVSEPRVLKLSSSAPDEEIRIRPAERGSNAIARSPEHQDVAAVDTRSSGPFLVEVRQGRVVCMPTEAGIAVQEVLPLPELRAFEPISVPLDGWLFDCHDAWLAEELRSMRAAGDTWSLCVAAGMYARLAEPESSATARSRVEAMLRGEIDDTLAAPRLWARGLSPAQLSTLEELAMAEVDRIHEALDQIGDATELDATGWAEDWLATCRARDNLEGVHLLLREAGRGESLGRALAALDRQGRGTRLGVPLKDLPEDVQLLRARQRDPDAWWGDVRRG